MRKKEKKVLNLITIACLPASIVCGSTVVYLYINQFSVYITIGNFTVGFMHTYIKIYAKKAAVNEEEQQKKMELKMSPDDGKQLKHCQSLASIDRWRDASAH